MFSIGQIVFSAIVGTGSSFVLLVVYRWWFPDARLPISQAMAAAVVVGASILFWRLAGNVAPLNEDPLPLVSPNDALCPLVTYVFVGLSGGLRGDRDQRHWERIRAALTVLSFAVNVVTI